MNYRFSQLLTLALGLAGSFALVQPATLAQATFQNYQAPINPNGTGYQQNERSSQDGEVLGAGFNPINLIHNANLQRSRGGGEFAEDTQGNLSKAASDFKRQQLQQIQQSQGNPTPAGAKP